MRHFVILFLPATQLHGYNWQLGIFSAGSSVNEDPRYLDSIAFGLGERWLSLVLKRRKADGSGIQILAQGNFSLGFGGLINLLLALAVVTLGLASVLAWQGYWPILIIAIAQLTLVSIVFVRTWRLSWVQEHIDINDESITVNHNRYKRTRQCLLDTAWAVVEVRQPEVAWYGPRIFLRSGRKSVEVGAFLTSEEKQQLAKCMNTAIEKRSALNGAINF